jgi:hypothetical protein
MLDPTLVGNFTLGLWLTLVPLLITWTIFHLIEKISNPPRSLRTEKRVTAWFIKRYFVFLAVGSIGSFVTTMSKDSFYGLCNAISENPTEVIGLSIWVIGLLFFLFLLLTRTPRIGTGAANATRSATDGDQRTGG